MTKNERQSHKDASFNFNFVAIFYCKTNVCHERIEFLVSRDWNVSPPPPLLFSLLHLLSYFAHNFGKQQQDILLREEEKDGEDEGWSAKEKLRREDEGSLLLNSISRFSSERTDNIPWINSQDRSSGESTYLLVRKEDVCVLFFSHLPPQTSGIFLPCPSSSLSSFISHL